MAVEIVQEIERLDDLTGLVKILQPSVEQRAIVGITRQAIHHQIDVLFRRILEWERTGMWRDGPFVEAVVVKIDIYLTFNTQLVGCSLEGENGNRVIVSVAHPTHFCFRLDINPSSRNMSVVPLAGPHHCPMGTKFDGLIVKVLCLMDDAHTFHNADPPARRGWNKTLIAARDHKLAPSAA